jgi:hypothetical protein
MTELPGSIRIELIPEMKQYVSGSTFISTLNHRGFNTKEGKYQAILDEIKKIPGVKDVWFTDDKETNLFVEIEVNSLQEGLKIESDIKKMTYVKATELSVSTEEILR